MWNERNVRIGIGGEKVWGGEVLVVRENAMLWVCLGE
jgi:hypothetical protein